jgi:hypothetical protein
MENKKIAGIVIIMLCITIFSSFATTKKGIILSDDNNPTLNIVNHGDIKYMMREDRSSSATHLQKSINEVEISSEYPPSNWTAESNVEFATLGESVTFGDFNGDNYVDVVGGSTLFGSGSNCEGLVFIWNSSSAGLVPNGTPENADWKARSMQNNSGFGGSEAVVPGYFNGDGYDDLLIGSYLYDNGEEDEGALFVWYGSAEGLGPVEGTPDSAEWIAESNQAFGYMGRALATGDFNGDGFDDVLAGAFGYDNGEQEEGVIFVWYGSANGLGQTGSPVNADWTAESNDPGALFGWGVATGDFNGDTYDDVLIASVMYHYTNGIGGALFVWYGSDMGLGSDGNPSNFDWFADLLLDYHWIAPPVTSGDFNGDGYDEAVVGTLYSSNGQEKEGIVLIWDGSATGLGPTGSPANADWKAESNQAGALLGISLASGDVNNDGYDDLLTGATAFSNPEKNEGMIFAWLGSDNGLGAEGTPENADWKAESNQLTGSCFLGDSVALGDYNNDLYDDILSGAPWYANPDLCEGMIFLWEGGQITPVNDPPEPPNITGGNKGKVGEEYEYAFVITDYQENNVSLFVDWGDTTSSGWTDFFPSGEEITLSHTWENKGTYVIKARGKDIYDAIGEWGLLEIEMPVLHTSLCVQYLEYFRNVDPLLLKNRRGA